MKILVLNAGSSSLKFQLFEMKDQQVIVAGLVEKIGEEIGGLTYKNETLGKSSREVQVPNHQAGLSLIADLLLDKKHGFLTGASELQAVGHRVVHGAELYSQPTVVTDEVLAELHKISFLAPLHNPANLKGIEVAKEVFPEATQVAVFDTAFHQTLPELAYRFPIPKNFYTDHGMRVYGFHGTSHAYVSRAGAAFMDIADDAFHAITVHLGNGCSMAAIKGGKSVDVSMGLTPLGGLIMGTRSGDVDPSLPLFMADHLDMDLKEIDRTLNKESGLKGLTGDNDLRAIEDRYEKGDTEAILAIDMYAYRIKKYIGSYLAALGRVDAIIFTAGVGENSSLIRGKVCENMVNLGIEMDADLNESSSRAERSISTPSSPIQLLVIPTNEELEIATQTERLV